MSKRLIGGILLGMLWLGLPAGVLALNVNPPQGNDLSEAEVFFTKVLHTTSNPVIAAMARDSLLKIQTGDAKESPAAVASPAPSKTVAEVALLPQTDSTYVVPVVVNKNVMATFLIDTGASYTVITPETAKAIGVEVTKETPTVPVTTANGTIDAPVVRLRNVSLGGMLVNDVEAVVTPLGATPQLSGLLGMSFFRGMEISFKQDRLIISR
ncbi:MAG TPA: TIGR02281 family clan AA aspartic protease [Coleofasciculaceae cyanobacterium]|jgi:aspartyl protease family protein